MKYVPLLKIRVFYIIATIIIINYCLFQLGRFSCDVNSERKKFSWLDYERARNEKTEKVIREVRTECSKEIEKCENAVNREIVSLNQTPKMEIETKDKLISKECGIVIDLKIENPMDEQIWVVISKGKGERTEKERIFKTNRKIENTFDVIRYNEGLGKSIVFYNKGEEKFKAIYVPKKRSVHFKAFCLEANGWKYEYLMAKRILVNGKTPLKNWLGNEIAVDTGSIIEDLSENVEKTDIWTKERKKEIEEEEFVKYMTVSEIIINKRIQHNKSGIENSPHKTSIIPNYY